ncbi:tetratricopeptide repeat protein [Vacuolonema iberomarrocanum]|uniref:tetratricopeptide repeat protein n=1 Tax=Vacuolonema iberomarrocanum TaxID=3454632 RepID=UPI0019FF98C9|nr:tetratricopeptide repeat protein [filamentous cyanobacterium LEGE 07170]
MSATTDTTTGGQDLNDPDALLERYQAALQALQQDKIAPLQLIEVLRTRDRLQGLLDNALAKPQVSELSNQFWLQLATLDDRLRTCQKEIATHPDLPQWRQSFRPPESAWWWHFPKPPDVRDRYDWLWDALAIACLTASLALTQDIARRFIDDSFGGVWSSLGALTPAVMTLFAGGGAFTRLGRETVERLFENSPIHRSRWSEVKFGLSATLLALLVLFHTMLPRLALLYNEAGLRNLEAGAYTQAEGNFKRALKLRPNFAQAHYNLAVLYDDLEDAEKAEAQYQLAAQGDITAAFVSLGQQAIANQDYNEAIALSLEGLEQQEDDPSANPETTVNLYRNIAWARVQQANTDLELSSTEQDVLLTDAREALETALSIDPNDGAINCLLAQVLDIQGDPDALDFWQRCLELTSGTNPAELQWRLTARERLMIAESDTAGEVDDVDEPDDADTDEADN